MRNSNPIAAGLARHGGNERAFYDALKTEWQYHGLTSMEWDWFLAKQAQWEPEELTRNASEAKRKAAMHEARKLSTEDLDAIIAERRLK